MFKGKTAIITGAGRGIGRQTAILMAKEGANVVVNDLGGPPTGYGGDPTVAQSVVKEIKAAGGVAVAQTDSIGTWEGCKAVVDCAVKNFGPRIDILVNNAGILQPKRIWEMGEDDLDVVMNVCLKGAIGMVKYSVPHMQENGGTIVNVSSSSGLGMMHASNYGAAKEGLVGFTRCIARDLGEFGIRCISLRPLTTDSNMISPGVIDLIMATKQQYPDIPILGNHDTPDASIEGTSAHVAVSIAWLCTKHASPLNAREVYIHGGFLSVYAEPQLDLTQCNPMGWKLRDLCNPRIANQLTRGAVNRFKKPGEDDDDGDAMVVIPKKHHLGDDATVDTVRTSCSGSTGVPLKDGEEPDYGYGEASPDDGIEQAVVPLPGDEDFVGVAAQQLATKDDDVCQSGAFRAG